MNEPKFDLATAQLESINVNDISEIFQFEDEGLDTPDVLDIVTQIEKENAQLVPKTNQNLAGPSTPKTINVSNVNNFQQKLRNMVPTMHFPHSNVTINYHFHN